MTKKMWQELRNIGSYLYEIDQKIAEDLCGIIEVLEKEQENSRNELVKEIMQYEENTFSATDSKITEEEAEKVADDLIGNWIDDFCENSHYGEEIGDLLDDIRDN